MKIKMSTTKKRRIGKFITLGVIASVLVYGGYETYQHQQFAKSVGLPYSNMFDRYESKPIITGKNQNTPNIKSEAIANQESSEKPVIYVLYKVGCITCQTNFPKIKTAIKNYQGDARVFWVNAESSLGKDLIRKYRIQKASTLVLVAKSGRYQTYAITTSVDSDTVLAAFNLLGE